MAGIHARPHSLEDSRAVMTFSTILRVTAMTERFRLVPEGDAGRERYEPLRLELSKSFLLEDLG